MKLMDFLFQTCLQVDDVIVLSYLHAYTCLFSLYAQTVTFIGLKCGPPHIQPVLQAMVGDASPQVTYNRSPGVSPSSSVPLKYPDDKALKKIVLAVWFRGLKFSPIISEI